MRKTSFIALGLSFGLGFAVNHLSSQRSATAEGTAATGLVAKSSPHSVEQTQSNFIQALESKGLNVFATVDHTQNAANTELELAPTRVIIFGNPKAGTPLMQCQQTMGIDLPQKLLIWQDGDEVQIAYNDPRYLGGRHRLNGCGSEVISNIVQVLDGLTEQAIAPE